MRLKHPSNRLERKPPILTRSHLGPILARRGTSASGKPGKDVELGDREDGRRTKNNRSRYQIEGKKKRKKKKKTKINSST